MPKSTPDDFQFAESIKFSGNVVLAAGSDPQGNSVQVAQSLTSPADGWAKIGHVNHLPDPDGVSRQAFLYEVHENHIAASFAIALADTYKDSLEGLLTPEATRYLRSIQPLLSIQNSLTSTTPCGSTGRGRSSHVPESALRLIR